VRAKISQNFETIIACYENDNFLVSRNPMTGEFTQERMQLSNEKKIKKIITHGNDFYIVCCKDYDKELDIISTRSNWSYVRDKQFKVSIRR
jgi:hypothetical protein